MDAGKRKRARHVRITGGHITCTSCGWSVIEVVLLDPSRPLCLGCAGEQLGADVEAIREWLRSGKRRGAAPGR